MSRLSVVTWVKHHGTVRFNLPKDRYTLDDDRPDWLVDSDGNEWRVSWRLTGAVIGMTPYIDPLDYEVIMAHHNPETKFAGPDCVYMIIDEVKEID